MRRASTKTRYPGSSSLSFFLWRLARAPIIARPHVRDQAMESSEPMTETTSSIGFSRSTPDTACTILIMKGMRLRKQVKTLKSPSAPTPMQMTPISTEPIASSARPPAIHRVGPKMREVHTTQAGARWAKHAKANAAMMEAAPPAEPAAAISLTAGRSLPSSSVVSSIPAENHTAPKTAAATASTKAAAQATSCSGRDSGNGGRSRARSAPLWISSTFLSACLTGMPWSSGRLSMRASSGSTL
mmetsp:Transcript_116957/g.327273  ORF Transcript_116957/g.327273 Transcript_116957/m.327273 type:complete len:243 (+) Transcript_116957:750-1478(+)